MSCDWRYNILDNLYSNYRDSVSGLEAVLMIRRILITLIFLLLLLMVAMKIIFKFNKTKTGQATALVQKFQEYRAKVKQLIEAK